MIRYLIINIIELFAFNWIFVALSERAWFYINYSLICCLLTFLLFWGGGNVAYLTFVLYIVQFLKMLQSNKYFHFTFIIIKKELELLYGTTLKKSYKMDSFSNFKQDKYTYVNLTNADKNYKNMIVFGGTNCVVLP